MKTICLACLIYTLKDKPVKDNMYIYIFFIWLSKVIELGGLTDKDILHIHVDKRTLEYLQQTDTVLPDLLEKLPCPYLFIQIEPPSTQLEGMMNKYLLTDYSKDIYVYSDIDILIVKPISNFTDKTNEGLLYVCSESDLKDDNYGEGFPADFIKEGLPGYSAGKFAFTSKDLRDTFFKCVRDNCDYSTNYYTVEQPIFNRVAHSMPEALVEFNYMLDYVSFNGSDYNKDTTVFYDNAGDIANGLEKLKKIVSVLCLMAVLR